ncbi:hypothetical protein BH10PSE5_BH10PSE5_36000 [soil metagenome]
MTTADSVLDADQITRARLLLMTPVVKESMWPVLCAAAFAASTALTLATAMILAPPVITQHMVQSER